MTNPRSISAVHAAYRDDIGDLITRRPLPGPKVSQVSPFLFLNHHGPQNYPPGNNGLPFGPHPHRGFETLTFILEGSLMHKDTGGHESVIEAGGIQWMTAGSGLIHAELSPEHFKQDGGPMEILQLWINLPARLKMTEPRYTGLQASDLPTGDLAGGGTITSIAGEIGGVLGPISSLTGVDMSILRVPAGSELTLSAPKDRNVFFYVVRGKVKVGERDVDKFHLVEFRDDGDAILCTATEDSLVLFGHGDAIDEPMVAHGPFVMNTREEIQQAITDYHAGKFERVPINL